MNDDMNFAHEEDLEGQDEQEGMEADGGDGIARPATVPQQPDRVPVKLGIEERMNKAIRMAELMAECEEEKKRAAKIRAGVKVLEKTIEELRVEVLTGTVMADAGQVDLFRAPVEKEEAVQVFKDLAAQTEAAAAGKAPGVDPDFEATITDLNKVGA